MVYVYDAMRSDKKRIEAALIAATEAGVEEEVGLPVCHLYQLECDMMSCAHVDVATEVR